MPQLVFINCRRLRPTRLLLTSASSSIRRSTRFCVSLCGGGRYSPLDTICVGMGVAAEIASAPATSPTLAELLMPLPAANPFSTMRASLRWYSSEELEDGVTYGGQSWLRRGSGDSFFSALLLRDGDAAGRRKRSSS